MIGPDALGLVARKSLPLNVYRADRRTSDHDDPHAVRLVFSRRTTGHIVPLGKNCRLGRAALVPTLSDTHRSTGAKSRFSFRWPSRYLSLEFTHSRRLPMRDEHVESNERENAERSNAATGPRRVSDDEPAATSETADATTSDVPAALSALSHPADAEEASLSDEEIQMYRGRVAEGLYNSRDVADEVARRMMKRGDI
jgi:hypothetical protein